MTAAATRPVPSKTIVGAIVLPWRAKGSARAVRVRVVPYDVSLSLYRNPNPGVT